MKGFIKNNTLYVQTEDDAIMNLIEINVKSLDSLVFDKKTNEGKIIFTNRRNVQIENNFQRCGEIILLIL